MISNCQTLIYTFYTIRFKEIGIRKMKDFSFGIKSEYCVLDLNSIFSIIKNKNFPSDEESPQKGFIFKISFLIG